MRSPLKFQQETKFMLKKKYNILIIEYILLAYGNRFAKNTLFYSRHSYETLAYWVVNFRRRIYYYRNSIATGALFFTYSLHFYFIFIKNNTTQYRAESIVSINNLFIKMTVYLHFFFLLTLVIVFFFFH